MAVRSFQALMASALAAALLLAFSTGCARSARRDAQLPSRFDAPGPGAQRYVADPGSGEALRGPHAVRVGRGIERAAGRRGAELTPDPRLAQLAAWVADQREVHGGPPPAPVIELWTRHLGLYEPMPVVLALTQSDAASLEDRVAEGIGELMPQLRFTHYGAVTEQEQGMVHVVLVLSWRYARLEPVPRSIAVGQPLTVSGRLLPEMHGAQLVVTYPDGSSERGELVPGPGFALKVGTRGAGEHKVELLSTSRLGSTVVANFPLFVGVPIRTWVAIDAPPDGEGSLDATAAQERLLELINADRERAGLHKLALDDKLNAVALAHSEDMHVSGFVGHTSPTTGGPPDRVQRAGIRTPLVLENAGRGYSASEVHRGLMDSPGHRANVLSPDATHVGIGVLVEREDDRNAYLVTQLFTRFAQKLDLDDAPDDLVAAVNRERDRRKLDELDVDESLSALCADAARAYFDAPDGRSRQQIVEQLNRKAASQRRPYKQLAALLTVVTSLEEAAHIDTLLDPRARALGIGIAQGTRADTIDNAIAVVALIGY
jgi:uncharacterized protein YkwD